MLQRILFPGVLLYAASWGTVSAQTRVDVAVQGRNFDFSSAALTKPFKTGTVLPAVCSVSEAFFISNATPGQNLYGCVAANTWMVLSGAPVGGLPPAGGQSGKILSNNGTIADWRAFGGDVSGTAGALVVGKLQGRNVSASAPSSGQALLWSGSQWEPGTVGSGGGGGSLPTYTPIRTDSTNLSLPSVAAYTFRFGLSACPAAVSSSSVTVSGGTGTLWIAMGSDCTVKVRHNIVASCTAGCTAIGGSSGFEITDQPLYEWTVTAGTLASSGVAQLTPYAAMPLVAGANVALATSGGVTTISATGASVGAESTAYEYEEFVGGGDCNINSTGIAKLGWRVGSTNGGDGVSCAAATSAARPGTVQIATGTTLGNEVALWLPSGAVHPGASFTVRILFQLGSSTNVQSVVGMVNNVWQSSGTSSGVYFEKESADGTWFATAKQGGTRTRVTMGVAVSSGWMAAQIRRVDATTIGFKLASTLSGLASTSEVTVTSNLPTDLLIPALMVRSTTAASRELAADFYDIRITGLTR